MPMSWPSFPIIIIDSKIVQDVLAKLDAIQLDLNIVKKEILDMSAELEALKVQVAETVGVEQSVVVLLQGVTAKLDALAAELAAEGIDNAAVAELSQELKDNTDALSAAAAALS